MPAFLTVAGILIGVIGLFLVGFSIPIRDFSLGSTLIIAGSISIVGGLVVVGLGATVRELRKLAAKAPEKPSQVGRPAGAPVPARPAAPIPARSMPKPAVVNTTRGQRAEPRLEMPPPETSPDEPPPGNAPTAGELGAEGLRPGLFASIRGRAAVAAAVDTGNPTALSSPHNGNVEPHPFARDHEHPPETAPLPRSPSLSALAARTAARLDLPRAVPDLPRAAPERQANDPVAFERAAGGGEATERPTRNLFDTVWPSDAKPPAEKATETERKGAPGAASDGSTSAGTALEPRPLEILKSGVIDGMAYTLYTDGSIEAQLPQGTLRFSSIEDLRAHLEHHN
jgi:hypothetical protein